MSDWVHAVYIGRATFAASPIAWARRSGPTLGRLGQRKGVYVALDMAEGINGKTSTPRLSLYLPYCLSQDHRGGLDTGSPITTTDLCAQGARMPFSSSARLVVTIKQ